MVVTITDDDSTVVCGSSAAHPSHKKQLIVSNVSSKKPSLRFKNLTVDITPAQSPKKGTVKYVSKSWDVDDDFSESSEDSVEIRQKHLSKNMPRRKSVSKSTPKIPRSAASRRTSAQGRRPLRSRATTSELVDTTGRSSDGKRRMSTSSSSHSFTLTSEQGFSLLRGDWKNASPHTLAFPSYKRGNFQVVKSDMAFNVAQYFKEKRLFRVGDSLFAMQECGAVRLAGELENMAQQVIATTSEHSMTYHEFRECLLWPLMVFFEESLISRDHIAFQDGVIDLETMRNGSLEAVFAAGQVVAFQAPHLSIPPRYGVNHAVETFVTPVFDKICKNIFHLTAEMQNEFMMMLASLVTGYIIVTRRNVRRVHRTRVFFKVSEQKAGMARPCSLLVELIKGFLPPEFYLRPVSGDGGKKLNFKPHTQLVVFDNATCMFLEDDDLRHDILESKQPVAVMGSSIPIVSPESERLASKFCVIRLDGHVPTEMTNALNKEAGSVILRCMHLFRRNSGSLIVPPITLLSMKKNPENPRDLDLARGNNLKSDGDPFEDLNQKKFLENPMTNIFAKVLTGKTDDIDNTVFIKSM
jgi:hypothetical protein